MKPGEELEDLIARAEARGIKLELGKPIPYYADDQYDYAAHRRAPRVREVVKDEEGRIKSFVPGVETALGRQSSSRRRPRWTAQDLGHAAAGMGPMQWDAIRWCLAMDKDAKHRLKSALILIAIDLKDRENWPAKLRRSDCMCGSTRDPKRYIQDLCTLALLEGYNPQQLGTHAARAEWFGLSESHWRHAIARGYQGLYRHLEAWYLGALEHLRSNLRATPRRA